MQFVTWPYQLRRGHSDNPAEGACAMDAVNWLVHGKHGDAPECACPLIGQYVVRGNDAMDDITRQRLLPFLHRIAGSRSHEHEAMRARIFWFAAVHVFGLHVLNNAGLHECAVTLHDLLNAKAKQMRVTQAGASAMIERGEEGAWDAYFAVLDEALNAGPQGEPWSADVVEIGVGLYDKAVA